MEEVNSLRDAINRRHCEPPCGDLREAQEAIRGLVEDRKRLNGSIARIDEHMGDLHEKVNALALDTTRDLGEVKQALAEAKLSLANTLAGAGWKLLLAIFAAGLSAGTALAIFALGRLMP